MKFTIAEIKGASLIAEDGEYIGEISGELCAKSIINEFGLHGGIFGVKSISNEFCIYGDEDSELSAYNKETRTPPKLMKDGELVAYVTKNESLSPSIDPDKLLDMLRREKIEIWGF